jgi:hypothetical protein
MLQVLARQQLLLRIPAHRDYQFRLNVIISLRDEPSDSM